MSIIQIQQNGWTAIDVALNDSELLELASTYGSPIPINGHLITKLRPKSKLESSPNTFASRYGEHAYPLHTDTAFWPIPARYVILCANGDNRRTTTLFRWESLLATFSQSELKQIESSIWNSTGRYGPFVCTAKFKFREDTGYRFDPISMHPLNNSARDAHQIFEDQFDKIKPTDFNWIKYKVLVIDNWKSLHGRGPRPYDESDREMSRIYVE
jgi:hypothetical protein